MIDIESLRILYSITAIEQPKGKTGKSPFKDRGYLARLNASLNKDSPIARVLGSDLDQIFRTIELYRPQTAQHLRRVAALSSLYADQFALPSEERGIIDTGALLHDLPKLGYPSVERDGPLSDLEYSRLQEHPMEAWYTLSTLGLPQPVCDIARDHHRYYHPHGKTYPKLPAPIGKNARIVNLADCIEAGLASRPNNPPKTPAELMDEFRTEQYWLDPELYDATMIILEQMQQDMVPHLYQSSTNKTPGQIFPSQLM